VISEIITVFPASASAGVYVNPNGDVPDEPGVTEPAPFAVIVTEVAFVNVLPVTVIGVVEQVLPFVAASTREGPFAHPHDTMKLTPVDEQPEALRTVILWLPFETPANVMPVWKTSPSRLYSKPAPVGLVTVIVAFPSP
jgi:hypothetical protein